MPLSQLRGRLFLSEIKGDLHILGLTILIISDSFRTRYMQGVVCRRAAFLILRAAASAADPLAVRQAMGRAAKAGAGFCMACLSDSL